MRTRNPKSSNLRACKCRDPRPKKPDHTLPIRHRSFFELLFSAFWCLAFLFYFAISLTHRNRDVSFTGSNSLSEKDTNLTNTVVKVENQSAPIRVSDLADDGLLELNISVGSHCPLQHNRVEELVLQILGHTALVCQAPSRGCRSGNLDLDEFRNMTSQGKKAGDNNHRINITHRLDLDGDKYNYASSFKGAKVVACNRDARGAGNVLEKDHDKYLRNPCSVGGKFVVVELAEETLVDAVKIANFELHSSNFKEFELLGSLSYPTETWSVLGGFVASNVKQAQTFTLPEPKWVRYLNLSLISHYGSEHYCTLSVFEVYGIDAIERMLEDLIVEPGAQSDGEFENKPDSGEKGIEKFEELSGNLVDLVIRVPDPIVEVRQKPLNSRIPGDSVLKILMQKVRSLELNLSMFEEFIRELSKRQGYMIPQLDNELQRISSIVENERKELREVLTWKDTMERESKEMQSWKSAVSSQMDALISESINLRFDVENVASTQTSLENREFAVLAINFLFMCVAFLMLVSRRVLTSLRKPRHSNHEVARSSKGWMVILLSSSLTMLIGLLSF